jgi:hypothetical protein
MTDPSHTQFTLPSRTGALFTAEVTTESDGSLAILSKKDRGYRSAHRAYASEWFNHQRLNCLHRLSWINKSGVEVAFTCWKPIT